VIRGVYVCIELCLDSNWRGICDADGIHGVILDREFDWLEKLAGQRVDRELAKRLSRSFGTPGRQPERPDSRADVLRRL
jgi:hypothetical protein